MARSVVAGRLTARTDEPCAVFIVGMWLPLHEDSRAVSHEGTVAEARRRHRQSLYRLTH